MRWIVGRFVSVGRAAASGAFARHPQRSRRRAAGGERAAAGGERAAARAVGGGAAGWEASGGAVLQGRPEEGPGAGRGAAAASSTGPRRTGRSPTMSTRRSGCRCRTRARAVAASLMFEDEVDQYQEEIVWVRGHVRRFRISRGRCRSLRAARAGPPPRSDLRCARRGRLAGRAAGGRDRRAAQQGAGDRDGQGRRDP